MAERALHAWTSGAAATALRLALEVPELLPGQPGMLWLFSRLRRAEGAAAEAPVGRLVALDPSNVLLPDDQSIGPAIGSGPML